MGFFAWIGKLFSRNGKDDHQAVSSIPSLKQCTENAPTFKGRCVDHYAKQVQGKFEHINASLDDVDEDDLVDEWTDS